MVCTLANISVETYYSTSTFSFHVRYRTESIVVVPHGKWHWWGPRIRGASTPQVESCKHERWGRQCAQHASAEITPNPTPPGPSVGGGGLIFKRGSQPVRERALLAADVCAAMRCAAAW